MSDPTHRGRMPSARALRTLGRLLPRELREAVIGDLLEHHHADGRFWPQALRSTLVLLPRRALELLRRATAAEVPVTGIVTDLRTATRTLRRAPLFTVAATLTLAVAIGTVVAIYGVAAPVVLRPLPYPDASRLVLVSEQDAEGRRSNVGYQTWLDLVARSHTVEQSAVRGSWLPVLSDASGAERVSGLRVSWQYFATLGVHPALGRDFVADDDRPDARNKVIISRGLWTRRFGADRAIVGQSIDVDGIAMTVVGVMPAGFEDALAPEVQLWRVLGYTATQEWACRSCRHLRMVARLRPAITPDAAARELSAISATLVAEHPRDYPRAGALVTPLQEAAAGSARAPLVALLAATVLLLLIAIANVAGLQLARAVRREGEFAVRTALGAGRARLTRQLLAEGFVLALVAGALGALGAVAAVPAIVARMPEALVGLSRARVDAGALGVAVLVSLVSALLVGVAPVWRLERRMGASGWRAGARVAGGARVARAGIVVGEVAVATMLLAAAALVGRSMLALLAVDPGFRADHVLTVEYQLSGPRFRFDSARAVYAHHARVVDAMRALPGVTSAGVTSQLPLGGNFDSYGVAAEDRPLDNPELAPSASRYVVTHDFARAMGIALVRGRTIAAADERDTSRLVVLVSEALAHRIWGAENPIGRRVRLGGPTRPWRTIVGVTRDVRHTGLDDDAPLQVYIPMGQWWMADNEVTLAVRTSGDPTALAATVRRTLATLDPMVPLGRVATMDQVVALSTAQRRLALELLTAFGAVALLLTVAGLYALLAGTVAERTRELGVRSALGATPRALLALVLGDGARLTSAGLLLGLVGAAVGTRALKSLLFGVAPGDPATLAGIATLLACIAMAACLVPACRATRIAPTEALRGE